MQKHGLEAYKDSIREVSDLLIQRSLQNLREVEVFLLCCVEPRDLDTPVAQAYTSMVVQLCFDFGRGLGSAWRDRQYTIFVTKMQAIWQEYENDERERIFVEALNSSATLRNAITSPASVDLPARMEVDHRAVSEDPWIPSTIAPAISMHSAQSQQIENPIVDAETSQTSSFLSDANKLYCSIQGCRMNQKGFEGPLRYQQSNLTRHMKTHLNRNKWTCSICLQNFSRSDNLRKHRRNKHNIVEPRKGRGVQGMRRVTTF